MNSFNIFQLSSATSDKWVKMLMWSPVLLLSMISTKYGGVKLVNGMPSFTPLIIGSPMAIPVLINMSTDTLPQDQ
jgi:hypothetical protein